MNIISNKTLLVFKLIFTIVIILSLFNYCGQKNKKLVDKEISIEIPDSIFFPDTLKLIDYDKNWELNYNSFINSSFKFVTYVDLDCPCKNDIIRANKLLNTLINQKNSISFVIIGRAYSIELAEIEIEEFRKKFNINFPVLIDTAGMFESINMIKPNTVVLLKNSKVILGDSKIDKETISKINETIRKNL